MTKFETIRISLLALLLSLTSGAYAFVGSLAIGLGQANDIDPVTVEFTANAKVETEDNQLTTKIYFKPGKLRDEINMGAQNMVTISRYDLDKTWVLMGNGMYTEHELGEAEQAPEYTLVEQEVVGTEVVNGMQTTKYRTIFESDRGRFGGFTWVNEDNIAVKGFMVSEEGGEKMRILFELDQPVLTSQPDSLFELPAGAQEFSMPSLGNMPGNMPQNMPENMPENMPDMSGMMGGAAAGQAPPAQTGQPPAAQQGGEDQENFADEVVDAAQDGAKDATVDETRRGVSEGVRKGIRSLFGK